MMKVFEEFAGVAGLIVKHEDVLALSEEAQREYRDNARKTMKAFCDKGSLILPSGQELTFARETNAKNKRDYYVARHETRLFGNLSAYEITCEEGV